MFVIFIRFDESLVELIYYGVVVVIFSYIFVWNVGIMNKIIFRLLNKIFWNYKLLELYLSRYLCIFIYFYFFLCCVNILSVCLI